MRSPLARLGLAIALLCGSAALTAEPRVEAAALALMGRRPPRRARRDLLTCDDAPLLHATDASGDPR